MGAGHTAVAGGTIAGTAVYDQDNFFQIGPADITMAGGLSPYGTMAQGGNVWDLEETEFDLVNDSPSSARGVRGGSWIIPASGLSSSRRLDVAPTIAGNVGFRVATTPEPSTLLLAAMATVGLFWRRRR